jgi:septum site-determining protein MinC
MAIVSEDPSSSCYDIKSADLSLVALVLKTHDVTLVNAALKRQMDESPGFFDQDPVLIDVSHLESDPEGLGNFDGRPA